MKIRRQMPTLGSFLGRKELGVEFSACKNINAAIICSNGKFKARISVPYKVANGNRRNAKRQINRFELSGLYIRPWRIRPRARTVTMLNVQMASGHDRNILGGVLVQPSYA